MAAQNTEIFHTIALYVCRKTKSKDGDFNEKDVKDFLSNGNVSKEVLMIPAGTYVHFIL